MGDRWNRHMDEARTGPIGRWVERHPWIFWILFALLAAVVVFGLVWPLIDLARAALD